MSNSSDEVIKHGEHTRVWRQPGGARPNNAVRYSGVNDQYLAVSGVTTPISGGVNPIRVHDPKRRGQYKDVGSTIDPPDLPTASVMIRERLGGIPFTLADLRCPQTFYLPVGKCTDPSDFARGWNSYVHILSGGIPGDVDLGDRHMFDSDDALEDTVDFTFRASYAVGKMGFGDNASALIDREVIDAVFGSSVQCGDCGPQDDGSKRIYAVTKSSGAGSPGLPAEVIYTLDKTTWNEATITGIGATEDPVAIDIVGQFLVVVGEGAYYYSELNSETGAPGTFTRVSSGFVGANDPLDIYVLSPSEIFFSAQGGYIYRSEDITAGVSVLNAGSATTQDLLRIHGDGSDAIVAVGNSGTVVKSTNRGATWATPTTSPSGSNIQAIAVMDDRRYWAGDAAGDVWYTLNGGETWTEKGIGGTPTSVTDIVAATEEVIYVAYGSAGPAGNLASNWNGGVSNWVSSSPRILNLPITDRINRIAVPTGVHHTTMANNVALAALGSNGTDGALLLGVAAVQ